MAGLAAMPPRLYDRLQTSCEGAMSSDGARNFCKLDVRPDCARTV